MRSKVTDASEVPSGSIAQETDDGTTEESEKNSVLRKVVEDADGSIPVDTEDMTIGDEVHEREAYPAVVAVLLSAAQAVGNDASAPDLDEFSEVADETDEGKPGIEELIESRTE